MRSSNTLWMAWPSAARRMGLLAGLMPARNDGALRTTFTKRHESVCGTAVGLGRAVQEAAVTFSANAASFTSSCVAAPSNSAFGSTTISDDGLT